MADNLEDINRQIEEQQQKVLKAEEHYSSVKNNLSKLGEDYYKTTMLTIEEQKNVIAAYKNLHKTVLKEEENRKVHNKALEEGTKVERQIFEKEKQRLSELEKLKAEAQKPTFLQKMLGIANQDNSFEQMYRVRQRFGGIEQILTGNVASGISQFAGSFKMISNVMGGPLFLAIQTVTSGLLRLDKAIAETRNQVTSATGGALSPFRGDYVGSLSFRNQLQTNLRQYGMQGEWKDLAMASLQSTGMGSILNKQTGKVDDNLLAERVLTQGSTLKYMTSMGISADTINKIFRINRNLEKMDEIAAQSSQYRLAKLFSTSRTMTTQEGAEQAVSLYEQTKSLGVNFEWAARTVRRFDEALQKGEISLNDFAAISRGIRGADQGKAAGLAAMLKDYAMRTGLELPEEFMQANDVEAGLLLQTSKYLSDPRMKRALSGWTKEKAFDMGFSDTAVGRATALRTFAGGIFGAQVTPDMWLKSGQTGDLSPLLGQRASLPKTAQQTEESLEVDKEAKKLHEEELSIAGSIKEGIGQILRDFQTGVVVDLSEKSMTGLASEMNKLILAGPAPILYNSIQKGSEINSSPLTQPTK